MSVAPSEAAPVGPLERLHFSDGYAGLGERFVARLDPTPLPDPYLIAFNPDVATILGLEPGQSGRPEFVRLAAGCARFGNVEPFAAVYSGHQFGSYNPRLGDGRAITLGELEIPGGERFEWQVKGGGPTPFSRFADGRAVLRSTIREYLCSEAMHALGIPTTRALAIAGSDEPVYRESPETAAVLTRIAPSHMRFGSFEYFHYTAQPDAVKMLADYAIERLYPHLITIADDAERYAAFLREIVERTARLIARWQSVGFAHGVMNTDNMSIVGLTLDYGPYGFLDEYDAGFICNHTDAGGRYAFDRQPSIGLWNCQALAAALGTLVSKEDAATSLASYGRSFADAYTELLAAKFGLSERRKGDPELFADCYTTLQNGKVDHTIFFRALSSLARESTPYDDVVATLFENRSAWYDWQRAYRERLSTEPRPEGERHAAMKRANPKFVLRNYLAQDAIAAAERRDYTEIARLHDVLRRPFDEQPENERYAAPPPDWAAHIEVSCSS
jgi:uncharacterized protein YdiU (UPF0061 family)